MLLIVGGGRMGEALLGGLIAAGRAAESLAVVEVLAARREQLARAYPGVTVSRGAGRARRCAARRQAGRRARGGGRRRRRGRRARALGRRGRDDARDRGGGGRPPARRPRDAEHAGADRRGRVRDRAGSARGRRTSRGRSRCSARSASSCASRRRSSTPSRASPAPGPPTSSSSPRRWPRPGVLNGLPRDTAETLAFQTLAGAARLLAEGDAARRAARRGHLARRHHGRRPRRARAPRRARRVPGRRHGGDRGARASSAADPSSLRTPGVRLRGLRAMPRDGQPDPRSLRRGAAGAHPQRLAPQRHPHGHARGGRGAAADAASTSPI